MAIESVWFRGGTIGIQVAVKLVEDYEKSLVPAPLVEAMWKART